MIPFHVATTALVRPAHIAHKLVHPVHKVHKVHPVHKGAAMRMLDRGAHSNIDSAQQVVVRDPADSGPRSERSMHLRRPPRQSTRAQAVAAVCSERGRPAVRGVEIVGAAEEAGALVAAVPGDEAGATRIAAQVITSPFLLVAMPKVAGDVKFDKAPLNRLRSLLVVSALARWSSALPSSWSPVLRRDRSGFDVVADDVVGESVVGFGASSLFTFTGLIVPLACA